MTGDEPADTPDPLGSGPILQVLAAGLQLWVRSRCEAVESLDLQLHGSAWQLLRGQLEGVTLLARRVVYKDLRIEQVELRSDPLRLRLGGLLRGQPLQLDHPFRIRGQLAFTDEGLTHALTRPRWREFADQLAGELLGLVPLERLRIARNALIISARALGEARPMELETQPQAVDGTLEIEALNADLRFRLPMDPNIRIETACLEAGMLLLHGEALVTP